MSYDLFFWRTPQRNLVTDSATYALITADVEVTHLEEFDAEKVRGAIDEAFPGWDDEDGDLPFQVCFSRNYFSISMGASTPASVPEWFSEFAAKAGFTLFDPQTEPVEERELNHAESIAKQERKGEEERRWTREVASLRKRAAAGEATAQCELGNHYAFGEGVPVSLHDAAHWYGLAAENGHHDAMFNLAACYQRGDGVPKDGAKALHWYQCALVGDKMLAPFALGEIYMDGIFVPRDLEKATEYFQLALENDHPDAAAALKLLRTGDFSDEAKRRTWKYWKHE